VDASPGPLPIRLERAGRGPPRQPAALWAGGTVTYRGKHFDVESAKVWDLPGTAPPIGIVVSGPASCRLAGRQADAMIATQPVAGLGQMFDNAGGSGNRASARLRWPMTRIHRPPRGGR
jgi:alkanesulfonate monooxygenase SsuD/methylene tetrahydromethanopterin reductase-like flavin-dependent oxidoreductase (luciferase family)